MKVEEINYDGSLCFQRVANFLRVFAESRSLPVWISRKLLSLFVRLSTNRGMQRGTSNRKRKQNN